MLCFAGEKGRRKKGKKVRGLAREEGSKRKGRYGCVLFSKVGEGGRGGEGRREREELFLFVVLFGKPVMGMIKEGRE